MSDNHYDVIIIGTGAGGGTLAYHLAPSGKRILILERGDYVPREKDNWDPQAVNVDAQYNTKEPWRDKDGKDLHPHTNYYVGGNTKFYGAALFRLRKEDFGELRHHGGISPAWPISYDELEPYYTQAENLYQVHGNRGEDPTEPPASAALSLAGRQPRAAHSAARRRLRTLGLEALPRSGRRHARRKEPAQEPLHSLQYLRRFSLPGASAKSDAQVVCIDEALKYPNVTLLTNSLVKRLETDSSGREVKSVFVERNGSLRKLFRRHGRGLLRRDQLGRTAAALRQ